MLAVELFTSSQKDGFISWRAALIRPFSFCWAMASCSSVKRKAADMDEQEPHKKQKDELASAAELDDFLADEWSTPADTMVALKLMLAQFPKLDQVSLRPFVLRTQLYSSVKDRTSVDRELEAMKQQQVVRIFKLNSGQDDFAIMLLDDYLHQISVAKSRMESKHEADITVVFDWFQAFVIRFHTEVWISDSHLVRLLSEGGRVTDKQVSVLINAGLLVRQITDPTQYWFSIPSIGSLIKSLTQGRKELLQFLNKRRYKEVLLSQLEKRKLRSSSLDVRFHVRDLLGSSQICSSETPVGTLIRLARQ